MLEWLKEKFSGVFVLLIIIGFSVQHHESMPRNAIVYVDHKARVYYGEPTAIEEIYLGHRLAKMRAYQAYERDYSPDETSRNRGDFSGDSSCLIVYFLERIGIFHPIKRWNSDGTWNY